jgi:hypothetical protein
VIPERQRGGGIQFTQRRRFTVIYLIGLVLLVILAIVAAKGILSSRIAYDIDSSALALYWARKHRREGA